MKTFNAKELAHLETAELVEGYDDWVYDPTSLRFFQSPDDVEEQHEWDESGCPEYVFCCKPTHIEVDCKDVIERALGLIEWDEGENDFASILSVPG